MMHSRHFLNSHKAREDLQPTSNMAAAEDQIAEVSAELAEGCAIATEAPAFQWTLEEASSADLTKKALIEYM